MWLYNAAKIIELIGAALAAVIAARYYLQAQKQKQTVEASERVCALLTTSVEAWKARFEAEHAEYKKYQSETHDRNDKTNAQLLSLTTENTELRAKTDLSPVLAFQKEQNIFNEKFLEAMNALVKRIEELHPKPQRHHRPKASPARRQKSGKP